LTKRNFQAAVFAAISGVAALSCADGPGATGGSAGGVEVLAGNAGRSTTDGGGGGASTGAPGGGGTGGAAQPTSGGTGAGDAGGGAAQPTSGGTGGAADSTGAGMGGSGGAAVNPDLEALLREGIGDVVRPPPYEYGPYSQRRDVPHGTVKQFTYKDDTFWPNAPARGIKVFEPAQYEAGKEVALAVFCDGTASWAYLTDDADGGSYRTRHVLDNLMAEGLIPPFIGVFIGNDGDGGNRQAEYGPLTDKNVRFFVEAILPDVSKRYGYKFTSDPNQRAIIGESSGGIAAFTAAWQRPDWFRLVMSHSGSFVDLGNGGDRYPDIIRMTEEVKPLRLHLEGGRKDKNGGGKQHPAMAAALKAKGYAYQWFDTTEGTHGGPNGDTTFPEGLIWLWKGWKLR
jgi:enterochelin esterase-like enzyme